MTRSYIWCNVLSNVTLPPFNSFRWDWYFRKVYRHKEILQYFHNSFILNCGGSMYNLFLFYFILNCDELTHLLLKRCKILVDIHLTPIKSHDYIPLSPCSCTHVEFWINRLLLIIQSFITWFMYNLNEEKPWNLNMF